ncbi:MAG: hypothetical protein DLM55_05210 [Acidimicrobiales bacterium]|nr:MAG: hypothetical protein DLM55_05210 [Acidimicrobiales bacterium]
MIGETKGNGVILGIAAISAAVVFLPLFVILATTGIDTSPISGGGVLNPSGIPAAYVKFVENAGKRCAEISAPVIAAQIKAESNWNPHAQTSVGAQGLAQFMPGTWATWGKDYNHDGSTSPLDPADAIGSQADFMCYLAGYMKEKLGTGVVKGDLLSLTLAAYNAGPSKVINYGGVPPLAETQSYIKKILADIENYSQPATGGKATIATQSSIADQAKLWLGYPYVWGGGGTSGPSGRGSDGRGPGFDCSGLIQYAVYHATGITLPRVADAQIRDSRGTLISRDWSQMQTGDIIGFSNSGGGNYQHIGIYAGNGKLLDAPTTGQNVELTDLKNSSYFRPMVWQIRRFSK